MLPNFTYFGLFGCLKYLKYLQSKVTIFYEGNRDEKRHQKTTKSK